MKQYEHLTREERFILGAYLSDGLSLRAVSRKLKRSVGTISLEIKKNSPTEKRDGYIPEYASTISHFRKWDANSHNPMKKDAVKKYVIEKLKSDWSPEQIAGRIAVDFPYDPAMRISHETIYQYANSREGKEHGLINHLRRGRPRRERRYRIKGTSAKVPIHNRVGIQKRPGIVAARKRFGDWEGDTMKGTMTGPALNVVGDRRSRFALLKKIPNLTAAVTRHALVEKLKPWPKTVRRTLTFDNGVENAEHEKTARLLGMNIFFCDSYASWQKGFVENLIGLIRQYLPKGKSLESLHTRQLRRIQDRLNHRPRKSLNFLTPHEVLSTHLKRLGVQLPA